MVLKFEFAFIYLFFTIIWMIKSEFCTPKTKTIPQNRAIKKLKFNASENQIEIILF